MHTLHLINFKVERRIKAVVGVREALEHLGAEDGATSLGRARDIVNALRDTNGEPQLVGEHESLERVEAAEQILESHDCLAIVDLDDPGTDAEQSPRSLLRDLVEPSFTIAQAQTAMACLAFAGGNPSKALAFCRTLSHTTDEDEFFDGVANALLSTFPPPPDDGPGIPVVVMR